MQTAKVKVKDMVSSAKEKAKEGLAKAQGKAGEATATTQGEKEIARTNKAQANVDKHQEKAKHRADAATTRHGTRVPLTGLHGRHRPVGPAGDAVDPSYPASDKYI